MDAIPIVHAAPDDLPAVGFDMSLAETARF
jgi:hypothetical protein